jgi:hypothetical protein
MARCPNYSQTVADAYLTAIRAAANDSEAAAFAGVTEATIRVWRRRRPEFAAKADKVKADAAVVNMSRVRTAAVGTPGPDGDPPNWRASLILAQRFSQDHELARLRELTTDAV